MKQNIFILLNITIAFLYSCTTVKVTKVTTGTEEGLRYSLGKPFIQVNPNPSGDGTYSAELVYLPDEEQTYAVQTSVFLTKYTMELNVDESGILKKVDLSKSGDSPASDAIGAAGEMAKSKFESDQKKAAEADTENKAKIKGAADELAALNEALIQKGLELDAAKNELQSLKDTYQGDLVTPEIREKIRVTEVLIKKLDADKTALQIKISVRQQFANKLLGANEPSSAKAWGPVLFEIKDTYDRRKGTGSVSLEAVTWPDGKKQMQFETSDAVKEPAAAPKMPAITTTGTLVGNFDPNTGTCTITVEFNEAVLRMEPENSSIIHEDPKNPFRFAEKASLNLTGKKLNLNFDKKKLPPGNYQLQLAFAYQDNEGNKAGQAIIIIELK